MSNGGSKREKVVFMQNQGTGLPSPDFYAKQTNTKYTYDSPGGRHRLLWTSDHLEKDTIYGYGADGLQWSVCDGEYRFYHYDYRGSVVAVTDIDGNVTDTVKYDAYGSTVERTGESSLIFGYNGQYGVLTDPNGLLYMRTRFYNPALKRFMNADIIDGSIADSTSLNLYTYVNGNPISFVDPFGLSADRGNHPEPDWNPSGNFPIDGSFLERELGFIDNIKANTILNPKYDSIVIKALNNTAEAIIRHYRNKNKDNIEAEYAPYKNAIDRLIYSIQSKTPLQDFGDGIRIRIEISESVNTSFLNIAGDLIGFVPVLGEVYSIVDFLSEENGDLSSLGSALISAITEKDIAKLTPYADELGKLGNISKVMGAINLVKDIKERKSPENIKQRISIYIQQNQGPSYSYDVLVNEDQTFKEMNSGFTGTVIGREDKMFDIIYN